MSCDEERRARVGIRQQGDKCRVIRHCDSTADTVTNIVGLVKLRGAAEEEPFSLKLGILVGQLTILGNCTSVVI